MYFSGPCHKWTHNGVFVTQPIVSGPLRRPAGLMRVLVVRSGTDERSARPGRPERTAGLFDRAIIRHRAVTRPVQSSGTGSVLSAHAQGRVRCHFPCRNPQSMSEA